MVQPLALDVAPHGEATGWRKDEHLIDALAYIDPLSQEEKTKVDALIMEELKNSVKRPQDYLKEMPALPDFNLEGHPVLKAEYERVKAGQPMAQLDTTRYRLDEPPLNRRNDVAAWKAALENAHSQLEHQYNRLLNMELLLQFGPKAWQAHIRHLEVGHKRLEDMLAETRAAVEAVNRERKVSQLQAQEEMTDYEGRWATTVAKNREIDAACRELEAEIASLRAQLPAQEEGAPKDPFGVREGVEEDAHNPGANGQASEMDES
ncbi:breast carcinoma amplified sequence 2 [Coccomyxa subellipsoidea C-169]|uniref:Breast carcinoma amplified sequence 2 n=1 Tax=Coccomyxa subellipsoidea (strain C-169) TaxID=574566 RepID=I0Z9D5_COCSC|nr:breast carcinoma amplified sequence 2 [Coccomyxa subellipsoidea C-169]EIE27254.1 breast carcinoma amplified sequence 2 [Coccomyxa subellipsoidea C-169]|eukprot:XP_005651798.1 breast carcinoma amplified sequence 2 [Coccomyxa subellipsoidea C-169]